MRVHELAKQLSTDLIKKISSSELIEMLSEKKPGLKTMSSVSDDLIDFIYDRFNIKRSDKKEELRKEETKAAEVKKTEVKKEEPRKVEPKEEIKKEAPKVEAPKNDAPKNDAPDKKNNRENNKNKIRRSNSFSGHGLGGF